MKLLRCRSCGRYTLSESCPSCGGEARAPKPAAFSPKDRHGKYRRMLKRENFEDQG